MEEAVSIEKEGQKDACSLVPYTVRKITPVSGLDDCRN